MLLYSGFLKPFFFAMDPEQAHEIAAKALCSPVGGLIAACLPKLSEQRAARLRTAFCGMPLAHPIGLAAGFDKNATLYPSLAKFGFSFLEIGTVTAHAQPGNPKPRLFRLPKDEALINRMGFNNLGASAAATRLARQSLAIPLGGNIGKSKITENDRAIQDYETSFKALHAHVDYFVVNVSSPNTPGLRSLQDKEPLRRLLQHLMSLELVPKRPLFLKIAPDLEPSQLDDIVEVVTEAGLTGIIATNTTISRAGLSDPERVAQIGAGGLSGQPLKARATEVIAFLRQRLPKSMPIIGVGGISSGKDALEKILAGACCLQIYTSFIYRGPGAVLEIAKELADLLEARGFSNVSEAVGTGLP